MGGGLAGNGDPVRGDRVTAPVLDFDGCRPPEPPDGTRIEFEAGTDVYGAWRDDRQSAIAGYPAGDGGEVWCVYGETVPRTWTALVAEYGEDVIASAIRLTVTPEEAAKRELWPTQIHARLCPEDDCACDRCPLCEPETPMTVRIQLKRTKGWRLPPNTVSVARPSPWGNPWAVVQVPGGWAASWQWGGAGLGEPWHPGDDQRYIQCADRAEAQEAAVRVYRWWVERRPVLAAGLAGLRGKNLACWCPPQYACHVDVLLEMANGVTG